MKRMELLEEDDEGEVDRSEGGWGWEMGLGKASNRDQGSRGRGSHGAAILPWPQRDWGGRRIPCGERNRVASPLVGS